jgi:hypothetical protein
MSVYMITPGIRLNPELTFSPVLHLIQAGGSANDYCSLYLSCEPSPDEYEDPPGLVPIVPTSSMSTHQSNASGSGTTNGAFGRWTREGTYQFKFVINGPDGKMVCVKEAGEWSRYLQSRSLYRPTEPDVYLVPRFPSSLQRIMYVSSCFML